MSLVLHICPVCGEQVVPFPDGDESCYHAEYGGDIRPVEVAAVPDPADLRARTALALFRLQEDRRDAAFREAARRWYENLSVADRFWEDSRRKRVRREQVEAMRPFDRTVAMLADSWGGDLMRQLYRDDPLLDWIKHPWPKPDALDVWLSEDSRVPQVAEALGL